MPLIVDYLRGRWSAARPSQPGVYLMREPGAERSWVSYWDPMGFVPFQGPPAPVSGHREFFHLDDDVEGHPTPWSDPSIAELARANGWPETVDTKRR